MDGGMDQGKMKADRLKEQLGHALRASSDDVHAP